MWSGVSSGYLVLKAGPKFINNNKVMLHATDRGS